VTPLAVLQSYPPHDESLPALFASRCVVCADRELLAGELRAWRYAQARDAAELLAGTLCARGVAPGDRVSLVSLNSDWAPLLLLALGRIGAVFVPTNPALTPNELAYVLGHCGTKLVLTTRADIGKVREAAALAASTPGAESRGAPEVVLTEDLDGDAVDADALLQALARQPRAPLPPPPAADAPLVIIYTSGTTGFPKGVVHSQRNYVLAAEAFVERMHLQPGERLMAILPFFHINALFYSLGGAIACGGTLVTLPRFSASRFWQVAAQYGATQLNILAAVGNILPKRPRTEYDPAHRIRKIYGGPIPAEMMKAFQHEFGVPDLIEGFGMSEIPGALNNPFDGVRKIGSIGLPARHPRFPQGFAQARIADEDGRELPDGEVGELQVKTPIAMLRYFDDAKQTAEAFVDGWLRTGDLARRDADGYYYYVARKKDIIRRRGENIAGAELDRVLAAHPQILEAATIGVPAALGDEEILAVLVARSSPPPAPEEIADWCAARLAAMKVPRYIVFAESLPHTPSQRVAKFVLKQDATLVLRAWDREARQGDPP
jgi:crotonobetaine/carnitine-CoA ligase